MHTAMLRQEAGMRSTLVWFETTLEKLGPRLSRETILLLCPT